jgi:hypothetical protein
MAAARSSQRNMESEAEVWRLACQRVLNEAGRARLHDIRAALNSVAVSAEVLHLTSASAASPAPPMASQMLDTIRHDLAAAAEELTGLEALVTRTASPPPVRWTQAIEWAFSVSEPVSRRRQVTLVPPTAVPPVFADDGAGLCIALVLIEAVCAAPAGSQCVMRAVPEPASVTLEWIAPADASSDTLAPRLLATVFGPRARWSDDGDRRRLDLALVAQR